MESARAVARLKPQGEVAPPNYAYFAFSTDLKAGTDLDDFKRFTREMAADVSPDNLKAICVAGRGYWGLDRNAAAWLPSDPTLPHGEVPTFLGGILNTVPIFLEQQRRACLKIGHYFM